MARRSDHSRDELRTLILGAAREIAEEEGLSGLTARRIADRIGYAPGTIYNLFENLDDLILQVRGETLDAIFVYLSADASEGEPVDVLLSIANRYIAFVRKHANLWNLMFEHRLSDNAHVPDWYHEKSLRAMKLAEDALSGLFPSGQEAERFHHAQVLWTSLHGICSIQIGGKLVVNESAESMARSLITNYVAGLR